MGDIQPENPNLTSRVIFQDELTKMVEDSKNSITLDFRYGGYMNNWLSTQLGKQNPLAAQMSIGLHKVLPTAMFASEKIQDQPGVMLETSLIHAISQMESMLFAYDYGHYTKGYDVVVRLSWLALKGLWGRKTSSLWDLDNVSMRLTMDKNRKVIAFETSLDYYLPKLNFQLIEGYLYENDLGHEHLSTKQRVKMVNILTENTEYRRPEDYFEHAVELARKKVIITSTIANCDDGLYLLHKKG